MKYKCGYRHTFCLLFTLAGFLAVSGAGIISKYVCTGDSVQAFQNIAFNNCSSVVYLYTNGEINTLIAMWSFENCIRNKNLLPDYDERVFLHGNGTISMHNVHPWDQAKYIVKWQMGNIYMEDVVQIIVMDAPAEDCIPKILYAGSSLFAFLESHSCGKPVATLYWKGYGDVPNTYQPVLKLNPGSQDGTYYACIGGPALTCVRNGLDICSNFTIEGAKSPPTVLETRVVYIDVWSSVVIMVSSLILVIVVVIRIRMRCRQNQTNLSLTTYQKVDTTIIPSSRKMHLENSPV